MRITSIAIAAFSAILAISVLAPESLAQNAAYGASAGSMPVPNAPVNSTYQPTKSYVPEPVSNNAAAPAVGGYDPNAAPPNYQQQPNQSGQTYVAASGYASERLDGADGFSAEEIKGAGHRFFGKVSSGFASAVEYTFQKSGRPNGYIIGEEAGGAFVAGLRYGEGTLHTPDGGQYRVFWQGPSVGYDFGAEGSKTMVLVYNLNNPNQIYNRFAGIDGSAYLVGGVGVTYLARDDVVVAPIRSGVGLRLGANVGYLKYTRQPTWNPF
ncbi:DUF1134 domain-containing protein [Methyloceanibacter caenitepidi]|uniref:DUF1134 domain-containing protein n=1 Tax=Methyloceanibacter caenitepidi TaxID=1384459 RepID=A0A0A8K6X1_9HYPH|nr:DUF1134 domain-containing protein [Methyloceanibacter caenitepidi]BAQ18262.1 hypothetical protein GL4_2829 [Methyloceanibacter caenitepidi]